MSIVPCLQPRRRFTMKVKLLMLGLVFAAAGLTARGYSQQTTPTPAATPTATAGATATLSDVQPTPAAGATASGTGSSGFAGNSNYVYQDNQGGLFGRGWIRPSEPCFDNFISPISNPVYFEDPRNLTEARFIFLNHRVPTALGGNDVQLYALQLRAAISDNVSVIATKDGYVTSSNPVVGDGWADLSAGLKFNLLRDVQSQSLLSTGFTFEMPTGSESALQGRESGELNLFLSGAKQLGDRNYWISASGFRLPMNGDTGSDVWYWSNHLSRQVTDRFYLLTEFNWYHWLGSGTNGVPGVEGYDLFNLGSTGVSGNDIVSQAVGAKFKRDRHREIGLAYEFPLTERRDILQDRVNFNWIFRY